MLTNNIVLKSFLRQKSEDKMKCKLQSILKEKNELFKSMSKNYNDNFNFKKVKNICKKNSIRLIGMGGSILGSKAIFSFLREKVSNEKSAP